MRGWMGYGLVVGGLFGLMVSLTPPARSAGENGACLQIRAACKAAGYEPGGRRRGTGLKGDCMDPLLSGATTDPAGKPLPAIQSGLAARCKAQQQRAGQNAELVSETQARESQSAPPTVTDVLPAGTVRPNFVIFLADDFSMNLISSRSDILARSMPHLRQMQADGMTFENYFVTDSLCCPSRSTIFTGKLPHNTGVFGNTPPEGGYVGFVTHGNEPHTFAVALSGVGYRAAMLGKYLNGYAPAKSRQPPGWSDWAVAGSQGYREFNFELNENGTVRKHADYLTDVISSLGQAFIERSARAPFVIELASFAPHAPYTPPARYAKEFPELHYDRVAPFGARADAQAPIWLQQIPALTEKDIAAIDEAFRNRVRSDHAIDDMIGAVRAELKRLGLERSTYLIFTSDNGYHMGEYSLRPGKMTALDTDIRVPLIMVGPGIPAGAVVREFAENIDLCPTITELAGVTGATAPDGHSLVPLLHPGADRATLPWRSLVLVEHRHPGPDITDPDLPEPSSGNPPSYEAIRLADALYVEYRDTKQESDYYDLKSDPLELRNLAATLTPERRARLHDILQANSHCQGSEACWAAQRMLP
jgi:N-acetylglucosamine-6-sulfatase